jgi:uncharacterized protein with PIN domain
MKFLTDRMLGKLTRWLRILGYDTLYSPPFKSDKDIVEEAKKESRILLTRDTKLARNFTVPTLLIESQDIEGQLREVVIRFLLDTKTFLFSRCPLCNEELDKISKLKVKEEKKIPNGVKRSIDEFRYCKRCDKYYWEGNHHQRIKECLLKIKVSI